ncbi:MAG: hypothetical protein ACRDX8_10825, partial [Acidimicrobiales bacterium]
MTMQQEREMQGLALPQSPRDHPRRTRPYRLRYWRRRVAVVLILALFPIGWSYGHALTVAGGGSFGVRSVEWLRGHGGASLVVAAEDFWYNHHKPPKGGKPPAGYFGSGGSTSPRGSGTSTKGGGSGAKTLPAPGPIAPIVTPALPGEGTWAPIGRKVNGSTAIYAAYVRPDPVYTSLVTGVAWMDPKLLTAKMFAGSQEPGGGPWPYSAP